MKTALALVAFLLVTLVAAAVPPCRVPALAQGPQGCCKERDALSSRAWRPNGLSFENCRRLNDKRDGDNVYQPAGFVWWDARCG